MKITRFCVQKLDIDPILTGENNYLQGTIADKTPQIKEIVKFLEPTALIYR